MDRRNWQRFLVAGVVIVIIAVVATLLLVHEEGLRGKIVKLEGNSVTLQGAEGGVQTVQLRSVEGLTEAQKSKSKATTPRR